MSEDRPPSQDSNTVVSIPEGLTVSLPEKTGRIRRYTLRGRPAPRPDGEVVKSRVAFAAMHVIADPLRSSRQSGTVSVDWDATVRDRHRTWDLGLGVAEAMDTAQRGAGIDWTRSKRLIEVVGSEAAARGARLVCGASTDQLPADEYVALSAISNAYIEQLDVISRAGAQPVLMASRHLARVAHGPDDYQRVYADVLRNCDQPVILHWLGESFDPQLRGYWGSHDRMRQLDSIASIVDSSPTKVDGVKVSVLDPAVEVMLRRRLSEIRTYTGDDLNFLDLIEGDAAGFSHPFLGLFDAISSTAATALRALDLSDHVTYRAILEPTVPMARHVFAAPTHQYKTDVVFLAFLNGHQSHFRMLGGYEAGRTILHLVQLFLLADQAHVLENPPLAVERMQRFLEGVGVV